MRKRSKVKVIRTTILGNAFLPEDALKYIDDCNIDLRLYNMEI